MLEINYYIFDRIKGSFPEKKIKDHIFHIWQYNRWIQISTPIEDENIHYEFIGGKIELHFEGDDYESKYAKFINYLMSKTENKEHFLWEEWDGAFRCQYMYPIESDNFENVLHDFIDYFDKLIDDYKQPTSNKQAITSLDEEDDAEIKTWDSSVNMYERTLEKVLKMPLSIPVYQRIYCWDERNVKCLLDDIFNHLINKKGDSHYRLGTIILHSYNDKYDIIDGQQRLVTLAMWLNELGLSSNLLDQKFKSKEAIDYVAYNKYIIHTFCQKHLEINDNFLNKMLHQVDFSVLVLKNSSIDLAYTFFSNQNSRGVALTDYDLLKAHHLRYIPQTFEQQSKRAAENWNKMIEEGRHKKDENEVPDHVRTLDTYIYRLRRWARKKPCEDGYDDYHVKYEYEAAPIIEEIPPFGERFYFNEPIQGGTHFFSFVEQHLNKFKHFAETEEYKILHDGMSSSYGSTMSYRDVIEALAFAYYLKFEEYCLADAIVVIMRCILQHRYINSHARKNSILRYVGELDLVLMLDRATSPTFFLAEAMTMTKEMSYPLMQEMKPIQHNIKKRAREISKELASKLSIESFKLLNK